MTDALRPVIVAFDGSAESRAALTSAADLFPGRTLVVVSVWEPGLAMAMQAQPDTFGMAYPLPNPEEIATVDRIQAEHAQGAAEAGLRMARELGATAEAMHVAEEVNIADTVLSTAVARNAAAIVVGSRGLGSLKSKLFGSTSRKVLDDADRPVVVVHPPG